MNTVNEFMNTWVLGIDPGIKGGVVVSRADRGEIHVFKAPKIGNRVNPLEFKKIIDRFNTQGNKIVLAWIEKQQTMPGQGAVSGFTIGFNYSTYVNSLMLLGIDFEEISPNEWRKAIVGSVSIRASKNRTLSPAEEVVRAKLKSDRRKNIMKTQSILVAQRMFSSVADQLENDGTAEAALICEACRRIVTSGNTGKPVVDPMASLMDAINKDAAVLAKPSGRKKKESLLLDAAEVPEFDLAVSV